MVRISEKNEITVDLTVFKVKVLKNAKKQGG